MKNIEKATNTEILSIKKCSKEKKNSQYIKKVIYKDFKNLDKSEVKFKDDAIVIQSMFKKYDSSFSKDEALYRGKVFYLDKPSDKELFNTFVSSAYKSMNDGTSFVPDSVFRSATTDLQEALKFAEITNKAKKSVIVTYSKRVSNELDISSFSAYSSEKEILINGGIRYKVVKFVQDKDKNIFIELEEML
jgi:hypothetical protein